MFRAATGLALAGATAVGVSVAAVFATTQDVEGCELPQGSLLDYARSTRAGVWYDDCFRTRVSIDELRSVGRTRTTDAFMQAFFRCRPMQLERKLLGYVHPKLPAPSDEKIQAMEFVDHDSVAVFTVIMRIPDEVLMEAVPPFGTLSYFSSRVVAEDNEVELLFGSALQGGGFHGIPFHEYAVIQLFMPFHLLYSRVLLSQAKATMIKDANPPRAQ